MTGKLLIVEDEPIVALDLQQELFKHALNTLAELPDLINQALEVYEHEDGSISVNMYDIPPPRS